MHSAPGWRRAIRFGLLVAAALFVLAWWSGRRLPAADAVAAQLSRAPLQGPTDREPFAFTHAGKRCEVRPVASYEIRGLVVSHNDIDSFADLYHDASSVDTRDLCLVWGRNVESGAYLEAEFWSGPFTCYLRTPAGLDFDRAAISNTHLITDRPELRKALAELHVGDQVRLAGLLVDYRMEDWGGSWRRTSTVREDADCEVLFLEELEVLAPNAPTWHALRRIAGWLLVALPLAWVAVAAAEVRSGRGTFGRLGPGR